jgi:hypothetical protein
MDLKPSRVDGAVPSGPLRAATVACLMVPAVGAFVVTRVTGMSMPVTMTVTAALPLGALIEPGTPNGSNAPASRRRGRPAADRYRAHARFPRH